MGNNTALVVNPGDTFTYSGSTGTDSVVSATSKSYVWVEGKLDAKSGATAAGYGVKFTTTKFSRVHHAAIVETGLNGILFSSTSPVNTITDSMIYRNGSATSDDAVKLSQADYNRVLDLTLVDNAGRGLMIGTGTVLYTNYTIVSKVRAYNNVGPMIATYDQTNAVVTDAVSVGNQQAVNLDSQDGAIVPNNTFSHFTAINSNPSVASADFYFNTDAGPSSTVSQILSLNSGQSAFRSFAANCKFANIVVGYTGATTAFFLNSSSGNVFSGYLGLSAGETCTVIASQGINGSCAAANSSTVTTIGSLNTTSSLVGKVTGDTTNVSDSAGTSSYASIGDWFDFENIFRAWGPTKAKGTTIHRPATSLTARSQGSPCSDFQS